MINACNNHFEQIANCASLELVNFSKWLFVTNCATYESRLTCCLTHKGEEMNKRARGGVVEREEKKKKKKSSHKLYSFSFGEAIFLIHQAPAY